MWEGWGGDEGGECEVAGGEEERARREGELAGWREEGSREEGER